MAASGGPLELQFVRHQVLVTSLQQVPEYMELLKIQKKVAPVGTIRQVLSYHTSRECWPNKKGGPLQSLKSAGLEQKILFAESPLAPVPDSAFFIKVELVSAFSDGDGMGFEYCSDVHTNLKLKEAQQEVCHGVLSQLLVCAPEAVHIHPNSLHGGEEAVRQLREAARLAARAVPRDVLGDLMGACATLPLDYEGSTRGERSERGQPLAASCEGALVGTAASEAEALATLRALLQSGPGPWRPWRLPRWAWTSFEQSLPRGGLREFLRKHPEEVVVHNLGRAHWMFALPAPASGSASGSAGVPPAGVADPEVAVAGRVRGAGSLEWLGGRIARASH